MSGKPGRCVLAGPLAAVAAAALALTACSTPVVVPADQVSVTRSLAELRADLNRLVALTERTDGEQSRSIQALQETLNNAIDAVRNDIATQRERSDVRHELLREILRALEATSAKQIDALGAEIHRLEARLDEVGRGRRPPTWGTYDARIIVPAGEKSLFAALAPSLIGTTLGALLALGSGLWQGRRTQQHSDAQKRLDVTIKLAETYLSPTMMTTFSEAQGLVNNAAKYNPTPQEMNRVVSMVGFFKYVCELKQMGRLDQKLLASSKILDFANEFFETIQAIPPQCRAQWDPIIKAAQPCT